MLARDLIRKPVPTLRDHALFVEELIYLSRRLRINSRHLGEIGQARALDRFQRAEMAQQRALAGRPDPRDFLQAGLADVLLAPRAVRADGEAVRLVAQPLDEIEQRIARRQLERRAAGHEEGLAPGVAVRPLGDGDQRHVGDAQRGQRLGRRGELALPAVDQHQIGPGLLVALALDSPVSTAASASSAVRRGALRQQPLEPPLQHLAQHAVVVAGREIGRADVELAVLVLAEAFRPRHHHGADRVACRRCGCCRRPRCGAARAAARKSRSAP